jgi:F-type H+-transporting ATPase subunit b
LEGLGLNLGWLLVQIFNFAIVFIILRKWVYFPMLDMLEKRRNVIAKGLEDARIASEARSNAEQEAEKIIADAQSEGSKIVRNSTERAESVARDIKAAAEAEAIKERDEALVGVQQERNRFLSDLRSQMPALAIAAAQKLIGEALDEQRQHALIDEFFSGVKSGKVVVMQDAQLSGASAEVTSALPLNEQEVEIVKSDILSKIGDQATVTFRVDPEILGGLVIKVGGKIIDASVAGQLESLRQSLS